MGSGLVRVATMSILSGITAVRVGVARAVELGSLKEDFAFRARGTGGSVWRLHATKLAVPFDGIAIFTRGNEGWFERGQHTTSATTTYLHHQARRSRRGSPPLQRAELRRQDEDDEKALELVAQRTALQPQPDAPAGALCGRRAAKTGSRP